MKLLGSLFLTACLSFGAKSNASAGDEENALLGKKLLEIRNKYPRFGEGALALKEMQTAIEEYSDQTKGKSGICPLHKIKMPVKEVPFRFGLLAGFGETKKAEFPFSDEFISGGCRPDSLFPKTGKVFVCLSVWRLGTAGWTPQRRRQQPPTQNELK